MTLLTLVAITVSSVSTSNIERVPEVDRVVSVSLIASAALSVPVTEMTGVSLVPCTVTVRVVLLVPPWESVIVYVKVSVTVCPTARACTEPLVLSSAYV